MSDEPVTATEILRREAEWKSDPKRQAAAEAVSEAVCGPIVARLVKLLEEKNGPANGDLVELFTESAPDARFKFERTVYDPATGRVVERQGTNDLPGLPDAKWTTIEQ
jgi:hypothetical protein